MILSLARLVIDVAYPITMGCIILIIMKTFQLVDVALDIINKSVPRKVTSKRAKKIFKHLRGLLVALMITAIVTLTAAIDLRSAGEEIELIHLYSIGGGLGNGCI